MSTSSLLTNCSRCIPPGIAIGKRLWVAMYLLAIWGLPVLAMPTLAATRQPNIVLFIVDDMAWDDPAFMGNPWHETPAMDRLAAEGVFFTDAYAAAPSCRPSRASLLTGLSPPRHGIYSVLRSDDGPRHEQRVLLPPTRLQLPPHLPGLASFLQAAGYTSALVGKWDLGEGGSAPEAFGFSVNTGGFRGGMLPSGFFSPYELPGLRQDMPGEYLTDRLAHEAQQFITGHAGQPFFLLLSHYAIHLPLQAPQETVRYFRRKPRAGTQFNATYAAMLRHVDASLAAVRMTLEAQGIAENTVIILTSDNGGLSGLLDLPSRLSGRKATLQEGGIRVPLVWHWPAAGWQAGARQVPVVLTDVVPTVLAAIGHDADVSAFDGASLLGCLQTGVCDHQRPLFWHFPAYVADAIDPDYFSIRPHSVMRQGRWKLYESLETGRLRLFDLEADLREEVDLAEALPLQAAVLQKQLAAWRLQVGAAMPEQLNPDYQALRGWRLYRYRLGLWLDRVRAKTWLALMRWQTR